VLTFNVALAPARYETAAAETRFYDDLFERVRSMPGVTGAGSTTLLPLTPGEFRDGFYRVGFPDKYPDVPRARLQGVTAGYLEAMGIKLVAGRMVQPTDRQGSPNVVVINEALQREYFPEGAIGRQIRFRRAVREIVGVVSDKRHRNLRQEPEPDLFVPRTQLEDPRGFSWIVVRHAGDPAPLIAAVRGAVRDTDSEVAIAGIQTMSQRVDRTLAPDRFRAVLVGALAGVALLLAVVGLYGLVAYAVARDARDTAIRMALGATSGRTAGLVVRRVLALTAAGVVIGIGLALASQRVLASFVADVTVRDPLTMAVVAVALLSAATLAAMGPALRASRVDPALVLRGQ
jgi:predicted permease